MFHRLRRGEQASVEGAHDFLALVENAHYGIAGLSFRTFNRADIKIACVRCRPTPKGEDFEAVTAGVHRAGVRSLQGHSGDVPCMTQKYALMSRFPGAK